MGMGKSSGSQQAVVTPEQSRLLGVQTNALENTFLPAYQKTIGQAADVYGQTVPAATSAAQTASDVAAQTGGVQQAAGTIGTGLGMAGLASMIDPRYEQQQVDAALQAGRESGREAMNQQTAGYGAAGGLGSSRAALANANLASLQEQRQATAAAGARAGVQANKAAAAEIAMIKVQAPNMALKIIDDAIQAHGGGGVSEDFGLASAWAHQRTLRLADGPDEVHNRAIARLELGKHGDMRPKDLSSGDLAVTR